MNPAFSVVMLTTLCGAAQGLVVMLALALFAGVPVGGGFVGIALLVAEALLVAGLVASFAHLGRPERAWRAARMWRTSWLSREVIVLPALIGVNAAWLFAERRGVVPAAWPLLAVVLSALLWYCTAMIYACLRFIEEWAQPLTLPNFVLIGLASGSVLASALAAGLGEPALLRVSGPTALALTLCAWACRLLSLRRNAARKPRSTLQSATGIKATKLVQTSMGMTAGSFNTREFFHRATPSGWRRIRLGFLVFGFALPAVLLALGLASGASVAWIGAALIQAPGLIAERWFFFADARHPQNLYYQVVS